MTLENIAVQLFASLTYLLLLYLNYSLVEIGVYLSVFTAVTMILEIPSGILVDSVGEKKVMIIACLLRACGLLAMASTQNYIILLLSALLTGVASSLSSGTLESWIVNEINQSGEEHEIGSVFAKVNIIGPFFGLISGFIGAQLLGKNNPSIPFYVAAILFLFLGIYIFCSRGLFDRKLQGGSLDDIKKVYEETVLNLVEVFKSSRLILYFILFTVPGFLDLGPSNQWQVILNQSMQSYVVGYYVIGIGVTSILANVFLSQYLLKQQQDTIKLIDIILLFDAMILMLISFFYGMFPYLFLVHVFLVGINGTLILTYVHNKLITKDHLRTSIISAFYSLQALLSSVLLIVNGYLSQMIGISYTWVVFTVISLVIFWMLKTAVR